MEAHAFFLSDAQLLGGSDLPKVAVETIAGAQDANGANSYFPPACRGASLILGL